MSELFSSLTEKIVVVLPRVGCPYFLEPHQIQGLDYINIFPVIQWLVKRSVENRAEKAERLFRFAADQFHNDFELESSKEIVARREAMLENIKRIEAKYQPKRRFRKRDVAEDQETRVKVTLLEYSGHGVGGAAAKVSEDVAELLSDLNETERLEFDEETRDAVFEDYTNLRTEFSKDDKEVEHQRQVNLLQAAKANLEKRLELLKEENSAVLKKKQEKETELQSLKQEKAEIVNVVSGKFKIF